MTNPPDPWDSVLREYRHRHVLLVRKSPFAAIVIVADGGDPESARRRAWYYLLHVRRYRYRRPRFWEFWRWFEERPPKELLT